MFYKAALPLELNSLNILKQCHNFQIWLGYKYGRYKPFKKGNVFPSQILLCNIVSLCLFSQCACVRQLTWHQQTGHAARVCHPQNVLVRNKLCLCDGAVGAVGEEGRRVLEHIDGVSGGDWEETFLTQRQVVHSTHTQRLYHTGQRQQQSLISRI